MRLPIQLFAGLALVVVACGRGGEVATSSAEIDAVHAWITHISGG
jgi:hypothetical protein